MLLIVLFLVIVIGVAAQQDKTPKALLQERFSRGENTQTTDTVITTGSITDNYLPNIDPLQTGTIDNEVTATGGLSDQDIQDTDMFIDSLIQ